MSGSEDDMRLSGFDAPERQVMSTVSFDDVLNLGLDDSKATKKQLERIAKTEAVEAKRSRHDQQLSERKALSEQAGQDASKWVPIVQQNRKAERLDFRHRGTAERFRPSTKSMNATVVPTTDLEKEINGIFEAAGVTETQLREAGDDEDVVKKTLTADEMEAMAASIAKVRARNAFSETKMKRWKKIKSRGFRARHRAASAAVQEKLAGLDLATLAELDPEMAKAEAKRRADAAARARVRQQRALASGTLNEDSEEEEEEEELTRDGVWALLDRERKAAELAHVDLPDYSDDESDDVIALPTTTTTASVHTAKRKVDSDASESSDDESEALDTAPAREEPKQARPLLISLDFAEPVETEKKIDEAPAAEAEDDVIEWEADSSDAEAVATAVNEEEFAAEREEAINAMVPAVQEIDEIAVPGWGSWAGAGASKRKRTPQWALAARKRQEELRKAALSARRDNGKEHLIVSAQTVPRALRRTLQATELPHNTTAKAYDAALAAPIGAEWTGDAAHNKSIVPRVLTATGVAIDPIRHTKEVELAGLSKRERRKLQNAKSLQRKLRVGAAGAALLHSKHRGMRKNLGN